MNPFLQALMNSLAGPKLPPAGQVYGDHIFDLTWHGKTPPLANRWDGPLAGPNMTPPMLNKQGQPNEMLPVMMDSNTPKLPQRMTQGPQGTAGGFDTGAMQALIDGPLDGRAFLLPGNSKSEADIYNAPLQQPQYFSMEPGTPQSWGAYQPTDPMRSLRLGLPVPQIQEAPVSDEEYLRLIQQMFSGARRM